MNTDEPSTDEARIDYMVNIKQTGKENKTILENSFMGNETSLLDYIQTIQTLGERFDFKDKIYLEIEVFFNEEEEEV